MYSTGKVCPNGFRDPFKTSKPAHRTLRSTVLGLALGLLAAPLLAQVTAVQGTVTNTDACDTHAAYNRLHEKEAISQIYKDNGFDGSEIGHYYLSDVVDASCPASEGRDQAREVSTAMSNIHSGPGLGYFGFHSYPSMPGFFTQTELDQQPAIYRSQALNSLGALVERNPEPPHSTGSKIAFTGEHLDITYRPAVEALLANIRVAFDADGGPESVGPIYGYYMLSEDGLGGRFLVDEWEVFNNTGQASVSARIRYGGGTQHQALFTDADPKYSFLAGVKRLIPLFSASARDSFVDYLDQALPGHNVTKLPADRNEFNHCGGSDSCLSNSMPSHVQFVPLTSAEPGYKQSAQYGAPVADIWRLWEEWCFKVWSEFIEEVAREISLAQSNNSSFQGVVYFQPPFATSLRDFYDQPVTYSYYSQPGQMTTVHNFDLRTWEHFESALDTPYYGTDMSYLLDSPWFSGVIHETATGAVYLEDGWASLPPATRQELIYQSDNYRIGFLAQGQALRNLVEQKGKVFGAFFNTTYFKANTALMPPADFEKAFDYLMDPLQPAILFSIGDKYLVDSDDSSWPFNPCPDETCGSLAQSFASKMATYRASADVMLTRVPWHRWADEGETVTFEVEAVGGITGLQYQWFHSSNGSSWTQLNNGGSVSGATAPTLSLSNIAGSQEGYYRCRVVGTNALPGGGSQGKTLYTHGAQLTVENVSAPQFTLNVSKSGTGSGTVTSSPAGISCGSACSATYNENTVITLTATPAAGSVFVGFSGSTDCSDGEVQMRNNRNCIATFDLEPTATHTLTVSKTGTGSGTVTSSPAGISCGSACSAEYEENTVIALTATPAAGSIFVGWSGSAGCGGTITLDADKTCVATFDTEGVTYRLMVFLNGSGSVTTDPAGIDCPGDCIEYYPENQWVTLLPNPADDSKLVGWTGSTDCQDGEVEMRNNRGCTANFELVTNGKNLTIQKLGLGSGRITTDVPGIDCGADCFQTYEENTLIELSCEPDPGYVCAGWSGSTDCTDGKLEMRAGRTCKMTFDPAP